MIFQKHDEIDKITKGHIRRHHQYLSIYYIRKHKNIDLKILKTKALSEMQTKSCLPEEYTENILYAVVVTKEEYTIAKMSQNQKDVYFHKDYWHYFEVYVYR
ncbi:MAG: hypothetical protein Q9M40_01700 [Sulfurimonas sp.]|nr:hypothetical protein [Sulfurimonas sp.]